MVQFLTVKRMSAGKIKIRSGAGTLLVEVDGKDKKVKGGGSLTLSGKNLRAWIRESPSR